MLWEGKFKKYLQYFLLKYKIASYCTLCIAVKGIVRIWILWKEANTTCKSVFIISTSCTLLQKILLSTFCECKTQCPLLLISFFFSFQRGLAKYHTEANAHFPSYLRSCQRIWWCPIANTILFYLVGEYVLKDTMLLTVSIWHILSVGNNDTHPSQLEGVH